MKQVLYAAVLIAFFATSAKANTKCYSCMKLVEAVLASGQDPRDMAKSDTIMVSGCMEYYTVEDGSGNADNEIDICFCDGDLCNENNCVCTAGKDSGGNSIAALSALTAA